MLLRICLCSLLVAMAAAQGDMGSGFMGNLEAQFGDVSATAFRGRHFYCLDLNGTRSDFPTDDYSEATGELATPYIWAIMLQYPVLSYLDSVRKTYLVEVIRQIAQAGDGAANELDALGLSDFCIGRVFHYRVSEYEESVLINFYFREGSIIQNPANMMGTVSIAEFDTYFVNGINAQGGTVPGGNNFVQMFRGQPALAIESVSTDPTILTMTELNVHPFGTDGEGGLLPANEDPTRRAVIISTSIGARDLNNVSIPRGSFADNPRPINFGLEAGDIVFIIFGVFFLAIMLFLVLLGFVIHPFFLA